MLILNRLQLSLLGLTLALARIVSSGSTCYKRELSIVGSNFFDQFNWETEDDPTHGRVNYLSLEDSKAKNLTYGWSSLLLLVLDRLTD
jgi:hypothetical protein